MRQRVTVAFLLPGRNFSLRWKDATPEKASKLFYSAEAISEASAAAGLLRQTHLLRLNVMQGEMKTLTFRLEGNGEVVRVEGKDILSWKIVPTPAGRELMYNSINFSLSHTHLWYIHRRH